MEVKMEDKKPEITIKNKSLENISSFINWARGLYLLTGAMIGFNVAIKLDSNFWESLCSVLICSVFWLPIWLVDVVSATL
jgi:hypothetical protein